jgi:hypothetical protein
MAYKIKNKKYTSGELFGAGVPSDVKDIFAVPKEPKEEKDDDLFGVSKEEKEQEAENYKIDKENAIEEINNDLYSEQIPIEIKDETTLIVKAGGETHTITRNDLANYSKQEGSQSGHRQLGSIGGDWRMIEGIANDISYTFNKLDEKLGHYKTAYQED